MKPAQGHCSLQNCFAISSVFILTLSVLVWLTQRCNHSNDHREKYLHPQLIYSAVDSCLSTTKATFASPFLSEIKLTLFVTAVVSHTLCCSLGSMGTLPLPISSQPSSILEVYWLVISNSIDIFKNTTHFGKPVCSNVLHTLKTMIRF